MAVWPTITDYVTGLTAALFTSIKDYIDGPTSVTIAGELGAEQLTNPGFTGNATGWTLGAGWAYSANTVVHTPGNTALLTQDPLGATATVIGTLYRIEVVQSAATVGSVYVYLGGVYAGFTEGASGAMTLVVYARAQTTEGLSIEPDTDYDGTITSVTVKAAATLLSASDDAGVRGVFADGSGSLYLNGPGSYETAGYSVQLLQETPDGEHYGWAFRRTDLGGLHDAKWFLAADSVRIEKGDGVSASAVYAFRNDGTFSVPAAVTLTPIAFASLPTAEEGMTAWVNDSSTNTWGATIAGGGANKVLAVYNGTNWTVAGK